MVIRPVKNLNLRFFDYYFLSDNYREKIRKLAGGININNIRKEHIEELEFPLPPLPEQNRIVVKLDKLFEQLEVINASLDKIPLLLKNFRQQVLTQAVTGKLTEEWRKGKDLEDWEKIPLSELLIDTPKNGAYYPKSQYGGGVRIIRIDAFYEGKLKYWEKVQKVVISKKDLETYCLQDGNILINRVNSIEYLGKCMLVENLQEPAIFESNMMRLIIDEEKADPSFLRYFLTSHIGKTELRKNAKHAVNQASINQTDVISVLVNIPGLKEQIQTVKRLDDILKMADTLEYEYKSVKKRVRSLPQSILHKAFKGELVQQLESDGDARELLREINRLKAQKS